jgi:hypothetical protein
MIAVGWSMIRRLNEFFEHFRSLNRGISLFPDNLKGGRFCSSKAEKSMKLRRYKNG